MRAKRPGPAVRLDGITRSFGGKPVLRGVTAEAAAGKVVGLLGRNGEGKSTLFHILLDMLAADSGEAEVLGLRPDGSGSIRQLVGHVPERPTFHEFMTVAEVFAFRSQFYKGWDMGWALALARQLELDCGTRIGGASKGTLGKTAWVCAAAHNPSLFLLDEPTSGLDALVRDDVLRHLVGELHESGKTILVANHHMEEFAGLLDEVWVLAGGVIRSVHDMEAIRTQACRVTGRLKPGASIPAGFGGAPLPAEGPLAGWAVFEREAVERLAASGALEGMDVSPLPVADALRLLLAEKAQEVR